MTSPTTPTTENPHESETRHGDSPVPATDNLQATSAPETTAEKPEETSAERSIEASTGTNAETPEPVAPVTETSATEDDQSGQPHASADVPGESSDSVPEDSPETLSEKDKLLKAVGGTSYKDLPTLLSLQKRLTRLQSEAAADDAAPDNSAHSSDTGLDKLEERLTQLITQHHSWQQKLVTDIEESIATIGTQIAEGHVSEAQSLWDRSHNTLKRIEDADAQERLQALLVPLKADLTKLLDWKKFAASEKKKELIQKMSALISDETTPPQKAKLIRALQDEWKTLGHSDDNDELWTQFSEAARLAFEPCKNYFKERKEKQASNLIARNNICEQLEAYAALMQEGQINLAEVSKLENQARDDWKKYAPVAQNKIKTLQKRFNDVLNDLRHKKRTALQAHNAQKQALISQAQALLEQEDLQAAINQAKTLQQDWKNLGPGSFKDDRKLWGDFRAACDALFAKRDATSKENKQQLRQASSAARDTLKNISALLSLNDEEFSESRGRFNALAEAFRNALTPDLKAERKALQEQFTKLSRRYDARLRATPDKKSLQLMQQVQNKADFCQRHEDTLLTGESTPDQQTLEGEWTTFAAINDSDIEQAMKKRYRQLIQHLGKTEAWKSLADKQEMRGRELCVEAEIMAGIDTPAADKAIRMQQQLNQLQRGLGRQPLTQKDKLQKMLETDMQFLCLGPLYPTSRSTLANRLQQIRQKL